MKQLLVQYATYNHWANKRFADLLVNLTDDQLQQHIESSFPGITKTVIHLWEVEWVWLQRLHGIDVTKKPGDDFTGSIVELGNNWLEQSKKWMEWTAIATEAVFEKQLTYRNLAGEEFTQPLWEICLHVFSHQGYHRGQLVTMLRQVGVTEGIPATDFIQYARKK